jgi:hypothetical protein
MELIRDLIEWFANDIATAGATLFPYLMVGLVGLYVLWLVIGYLRVSQVGIGEGHGSRQVLALPSGESAEADRRPGMPYCAIDGLQYPAGARFCTQCERDLNLDCATCGATLSAADTSCYRCGTPTGSAEPSLHG